MKDYYTKKKEQNVNPTADALARWALIIGIISLPTSVIPTLGIIMGAVSCTLAVLSFYNGDGYRANKAKIGLILGIITLITAFFFSYVVVYTLNHWSEYSEYLKSIKKQG